MAMRDGSLLSHNPTAAATVTPTITHSQLRHLVSCPQRRGIVYYVSDYAILETDLLNPTTPPLPIVKLDYLPTCFATTVHPSNPNALFLAAGGLRSNIHVSLHAFSQPFPTAPHVPPKTLWSFDTTNRGLQDIVNYMFFSPAELTDGTSLQHAASRSSFIATKSSTSGLRLIVCGNDASVRFYDVALHTQTREDLRLRPCGALSIDTCVNHASISPDGCTLLSAGDTPHVYLHRIMPGAWVTFEPLAKYLIPLPPPAGVRSFVAPESRTTYAQRDDHVPPPTAMPSVSTSAHTFHLPTLASQSPPPTPSFTSVTTHVFPFAHSLMAPRACFTTAWTSDGRKFAIAAQEGALAVWDVRSSVPVWVFWTGVRNHSPRRAEASGNNGDSDGSWDWTESQMAGHGVWWTSDARDAGTSMLNGSVGRTPSGGTTPASSLANIASLGSVTPQTTTPANVSGTEGRNVLDPSDAQADPNRVTLGTVRTRVDPRLPVQMYVDADPDTFGACGPANGIRNVRFSAGEAGRELCVFVEHTKHIHVIDARTFDPATHRVFVFPDTTDLVDELATRNANLSAGITSDVRLDSAVESSMTVRGDPDVLQSASTMEQDAQGLEEGEREQRGQERGEMVWPLLSGEDRERAWGTSEGQGNTPSVVLDTPTPEPNMQLETHHENSRLPASVLDPDPSTPTVQDASHGRESDVPGWLMESTSRSQYGTHYPHAIRSHSSSPISSHSRSPPLVVPFPRFRSRSRSRELAQPIVPRGPPLTTRRDSRSRSPPISTSLPSDSRAAQAPTLDAISDPAQGPSPDPAALSVWQLSNQIRESELAAARRARLVFEEPWTMRDWGESRDYVSVSEMEMTRRVDERRNAAGDGWNPDGRSNNRALGSSGGWSRRASQHSNPWVGRAWNNSGTRIPLGQSGSSGRTQVTAEGMVEFLDADGDVVPRENDGREHEQQTQGQSRRSQTRLQDANEYQRPGSMLLTPPSRTLVLPTSRPSPPPPFRRSPHTTPPPHSPHGSQTSSIAPELPSAIESTEPRLPHDPEIAGVCFDPTGEWVYVAGKGGIVEWRVRDREEGRGTGAGGWL